MPGKLSKYSDRELFKALCGKKEESEAAFSEIYSRFSQRIYAYCLRVTGSTDDAKDIFQDTFINFYNSIRNHSCIENIGGFLLTIARNLCLNFIRNKKYNINFEDMNFISNDSSYENRELMQIISSALELLDFPFRDAFILRQYHGLSYKEISVITGESLSAVKNRVWRAKEKLKNILSPILQDLSK